MTFGTKFWNIPPAQQWCDHSSTLTPPAPTLLSISVSPANKSLPIGLTQQYTATGNYSNGTSKNITAQVTWYAPPAPIGEPRPAPVASINASGLATASAQGQIRISATLGSISGNTLLYVTSASLQSITVTPANPTINQYLTQQFVATGNYSDGSTQDMTRTVTWSSGTTAVATISSGLATGVAAGSSTITASWGAKSGSTTLTVVAVFPVSIAVTPANPSIAKGTTQQFIATATYSDNTTRDITNQSTWSSATLSVATIDTNGLASGLTLGDSLITATFNNISGSTTLTVTAAALQSIAVMPVNPSVAQGLTKQFTATGTYSDTSEQDITSQVTWSSATTSVATIISGGLATGVGAGSSIIKAAQGTISGSTTLTVVMPGVNWVQAPYGLGGGNYFAAITWSGAEFVAVGTSGLVTTSPDSTTWTTRTSGTTNTLNAAVWTGSKIYAVGASMTTLSSTDGIIWTSLVPSGPGNDFSSIAWSGSTFVEGLVGTATHMTSPDAITFTTHASQPFNGAIWTGTQFVVVADSGFIYLSPDGLAWNNPTSGTTNNLRAVAWSGYQYAAVGNGGTILTSPDAITWTPRGIWASQNVRGVAWSGEHFVVVNEGGFIFVSAP